MNLGLFNRVNLKENSENKGMYAEWTSLSLTVQHFGQDTQSVLERFGLSVSKEMTLGVVKQLAGSLGITHAAEPSFLKTDREVMWCMEVLCFGLSLPLSEHDTIKDCVNIYCEWLSALLPSPKVCVPQPIRDDPHLYAQIIIAHLHYLFVPRKEEGVDTINRQAVLCHRVLRTLQQIACESQILDRETWESLLVFLLAINDTLLAPPAVKDDVADQLCERILSVLFEIWLLACLHCFPSPSIWKTLRKCCMNWRHRVGLMEQWNRLNLALTAKLLKIMYGSSFPEIDEDGIIPDGMSHDCIVQTWYRFLNTIGNPTCLTNPQVISQTQKFLQFAISTDGVTDPCQHPCLQNLPLAFLKAITGISAQIDALLGISKPSVTGTSSGNSSSLPVADPAPLSSISSISVSSYFDLHQPLALERPKSNSILHLFGEWLFEAAFVGCSLPQRNQSEQIKRPNSIVVDSAKSSLSYSETNSVSSFSEIPSCLTTDKFESGRAAALGVLCRVICAKKTGEEILPVYLARFYLAIQQGLAIPPNGCCGETVVAILMNSCDLFRLDLDGVNILLPSFINALEVVLPVKDLKIISGIDKIQLRRASITLLSSILVLPLHFQNAHTKESMSTVLLGPIECTVQLANLRTKLMNLVMNALQVETDSLNTQMLLGILFSSLQDYVSFELVEQVFQPQIETLSYPLSSGASDSLSTISAASSSDRPLAAPDFTMDSCDNSASVSAHALLVRTTYLVCHRLMTSWKSDLNVSLAALELLSGLANLHTKESDVLGCQQAVKWLCDYIVHQCSRPPPAHSKDLHSTIVAAFHCCSLWLLGHPYLLHDKDCLTTVLEVAELGISGMKSIDEPGQGSIMKEDKELKPASLRVRDAAEKLLACILQQVECFPNECGPESLSSLLNEVTLVQHCNSWINNCTDQVISVERFRYFVTEGSVILALLEEPLGNDQDPQPTVTVILRSPFGRHTWTMQLRHLPRHRSSTKYHAPNPGRPVAMQDMPARPHVRQNCFPEDVERAVPCKVDHSVPSVDSLANDDETLEEIEKLTDLISRQTVLESSLSSKQVLSTPSECIPPPVCHEFQTARLFLSQFGLLSSKSEGSEKSKGDGHLIALDSSMRGFCKDLNILDSMSSRTCDTVHIFYVRSQQSHPQEILSNILDERNVSPYFIEFLYTLGWPVDVSSHPGWTGHISTSYNVGSVSQDQKCGQSHYSGILLNGESHVLYWADACSEVAFVVPSTIPKAEECHERQTSSLSSWFERSLSTDSNSMRNKRTFSLDLDKQTAAQKTGHRSNLHPYLTTKIMVVWLESYEDHLKFPVGELINCTNTGLESSPVDPSEVRVIFLHMVSSGMLRIHLKGPSSRINLATPLVDGIVVSRRSLGPLVRQTAVNMAHRQKLDSESYQPPHLRRRLKIQEIMQKYKREMTESELLTYLFSSS